MIYVELPAMPTRRLPFYLATEEYVAQKLDAPEYFFMWQVNPTVIFGRNQLIEAEVNLEYCLSHEIETYRRKSGGGCVFADMSNIMFSYITTDTTVRLTFDKYMRIVAHTLRKLGVNAQASGRNDIMIDGRKVSGNAFYHKPGRSIVHGTMLFDTDIETMVRAISPSDEKIVSKGVKSVRAHVTNLKEHISMGIEEFKAFVRNELCGNNTVYLTAQDVKEIEEIEAEYLTPEFIFGNNPRYSTSLTKRIEGVGEFVADIEVKGNIIRSLNLRGDFFLTGDLDTGLINRLIGVEYTPSAVLHAINDINLDQIIHNLSNDNLIQILFKT